MKTQNFLVRRATRFDLEKLVSFAIAEANEAEKTSRSPEIIREGVKVGLNDDSVAMYWVLEKGGSEVIGNISVVREWSNWNSGYYWWIQSMFLHPEYRGKGLMGKLIKTVSELAKQEDAVELRLYVHNRNKRAIKAYQKTGFSNSDYRIMTMSL